MNDNDHDGWGLSLALWLCFLNAAEKKQKRVEFTHRSQGRGIWSTRNQIIAAGKEKNAPIEQTEASQKPRAQEIAAAQLVEDVTDAAGLYFVNRLLRNYEWSVIFTHTRTHTHGHRHHHHHRWLPHATSPPAPSSTTMPGMTYINTSKAIDLGQHSS